MFPNSTISPLSQSPFSKQKVKHLASEKAKQFAYIENSVE
jgi:hypothetical protein